MKQYATLWKRGAAVLTVVLMMALLVGCATRPVIAPTPTPPAVTQPTPAPQPEPTPPPEPEQVPSVVWPAGLPVPPDGTACAELPAEQRRPGEVFAAVLYTDREVVDAWQMGLVDAGFTPGDLCTDGYFVLTFEEHPEGFRVGVETEVAPEMPEGFDLVVPYEGNGIVYRYTVEEQDESKTLTVTILGTPEQIGMGDYLARIEEYGYADTGYGRYRMEADGVMCELVVDGFDKYEGRAELLWLIY